MNCGLYVHVPFCKSKCAYCDFARITDKSYANAYLSALEAEISRAKAEGYDAKTVYLGGGTPSYLGIDGLRRIFSALRAKFDLSKVEEMTVECNPEDVNPQFVDFIIDNGVNRVSLGVQSLTDPMLRLMNRRHSAQKVVDVVKMLKEKGVSNISVDFIYGLPLMEGYDYKEDIERFLALDVSHLSAYALSYEEGSLFSQMLAKGKIEKCADDDVESQYQHLIERMSQSGYEHYEISNFCKAGQYSRHNSSYWTGVPYFGFGPAASGFDGTMRYTNCPDVQTYAVTTLTGQTQRSEETLSADDKYNEAVMLGLRTRFGVPMDRIRKCGAKYEAYFREKVARFVADNSVNEKDGTYSIAENKWFISDYILAELFA